MLLLDESVAYLLIGDVQFNTYHKATAPHIDNMGKSLGLKAAHEVAADLGSIVNEVLVLYDIKHSQGSGAGQVVAAKGGAQLAEDRLKLRRDKQC